MFTKRDSRFVFRAKSKRRTMICLKVHYSQFLCCVGIWSYHNVWKKTPALEA